MFNKIKLKLAGKFIAWYDAFRARQLEKLRDAHWAEALSVVITSFDASQRPAAEVLLKNQIRFIRETQIHNKSFDVIPSIDSAVFMTSVRVIKHLLKLNRIVGIQPMTGPVGLVYLMAYSETNKENHYKLGVISRAVNAGSRSLAAGWSMEAAQDLKVQHGLDLEAELAQVIAQEVGYEYTREVLSDLTSLAEKSGNVTEFENIMFSLDFDVAEQSQRLSVEIARVANLIAAKTHRGAGNFVVLSPAALALLQMGTGSTFVATPDKSSYDDVLIYAGTLNDTIKVYVSHDVEDRIIIGYKGAATEVDTGYVLAPYVPLMQSGIVVNPTTFQPVMRLMTRYGKAATAIEHAEGKNTYNPSDYYGLIKLTQPALPTPVEVQQELFEANLVADQSAPTQP